MHIGICFCILQRRTVVIKEKFIRSLPTTSTYSTVVTQHFLLWDGRTSVLHTFKYVGYVRLEALMSSVSANFDKNFLDSVMCIFFAKKLILLYVIISSHFFYIQPLPLFACASPHHISRNHSLCDPHSF